jgi:hypothetical protein
MVADLELAVEATLQIRPGSDEHVATDLKRLDMLESDARLDPQADRYAWRRFHHAWTPPAAGRYGIMSRATNGAGQTQVTSQWNRSGYERNVIERINVVVA